eukprot:g1667.t1
MSEKTNEDSKLRNIAKMCADKVRGFDVVIVCTSDPSSERFWQKRLEDGEGVVPIETKICVVHEDWEGGAGNALGTLYAFQKADAKFKKDKSNAKGRGLVEAMTAGDISVALYHTAGKGTRLAPLPGSESNNKPGVKLPSMIKIGTKSECATILESVIRQTGLYAGVRKGRLSVFWGDQIFVPTVDATAAPTHHADILAMLGKFPSAKEWEERGLEKYGLITVNDKGDASQVEKVSHQTASKLLADMGTLVAAGTSLGSFSVSSRMLKELLNEFNSELKAKKGKLDTDPHWWMPFTLPEDGYVRLMERKGTSAADARAHWSRMRTFAKSRFKDTTHLLGAVNVGSQPYWWDYGQLKYYVANNLKLTESNEEASAMRRYFRIPSANTDGNFVDNESKLAKSPAVRVSDRSVVLGSTIYKGRVKRSVIVNCEIGEIDVEDCVLVNVTAPKVVLRGGVVYNVSEDDANALVLDDGVVAVDVATPDKSPSLSSHRSLRVFSHTGVCGGKAWKQKTCGNAVSFEHIYLENKSSSDLAGAHKFSKLKRQKSSELLRRTYSKEE